MSIGKWMAVLIASSWAIAEKSPETSRPQAAQVVVPKIEQKVLSSKVARPKDCPPCSASKKKVIRKASHSNSRHFHSGKKKTESTVTAKPKPLLPKDLAEPRYFGHDITSTQWRFEGSKHRCDLKQEIPSYGEVWISRLAGEAESSRIKSWRGLFSKAPVSFSALSPPWSDRNEFYPLFQSAADAQEEFQVRLGAQDTHRMLDSLFKGYFVRMRYQDQDGPSPEVVVAVSPVRFHSVYEQFVRCQSELLPYRFEEVSPLRIPFDAGAVSLNHHAQEQLGKVARYIRAGAKIKKIIISGHTDNAGWYELNRRVSEYRAQAAADYLKAEGVSGTLIETRAEGNERPIAKNDTREGRAKNRRIEVELIVEN